MNFVAITLLALVAVIAAAPVEISNNTVGDIVTIEINANALLSSQIDQNIVTVIAALLNKQAVGINANKQEPAENQAAVSENEAPIALNEVPEAPIALNEAPETPEFKLSPELIEKIKSQISPEVIEQFKSLIN